MLRFRPSASSANLPFRIAPSQCVVSIFQKPLRSIHHSLSSQQNPTMRYSLPSSSGQESQVQAASRISNLTRTKHVASPPNSSVSRGFSSFYTNAKAEFPTTPKLQVEHDDKTQPSTKHTTTKAEASRKFRPTKTTLNKYLKWTVVGAAIVTSISTTVVAMTIQQVTETLPQPITVINTMAEETSSTTSTQRQGSTEAIRNLATAPEMGAEAELSRANKTLKRDNQELKRLLKEEQVKVAAFEDRNWHASRYD